MMDIAVYTLTSELHDAKSIEVSTKEFLESLHLMDALRGDDYTDFGSHALNLIYVRTGGTEGIFKRLLPLFRQQYNRPFYLLTSGKSNSLAASMEILSFLQQQGLKGEIIHGNTTFISQKVQTILQVERAVCRLAATRLGVIGKPSDWLISSNADEALIQEKLGIQLVHISMEEVLDRFHRTKAISSEEQADWQTALSVPSKLQSSLPDAVRIYHTLKTIIAQYRLDGFTIRCFDLLTAVHNTGCLALAKLNAEGTVSGCEGDVPALLSMMIGQTLLGVSGFQANPAQIDVEKGELLFAHCTIPLNMVRTYDLDTHFESGIGIGIRGYMQEGPVTIFKVSGDLSRFFAEEGELIQNQAQPNLCRTQQVIRLADKSKAHYFLTRPIGNHHIILPGHCKALLEKVLQ